MARRQAPSSIEVASQTLQTRFAAVKISFTWLGVRKTLTAGQKAQAAEPFGAQREYLSASKKLLDTRNPRFRLVTALKSQIVSYWKNRSLPYPEPGLRLIRQDQIATFDQAMGLFKSQLDQAVAELDTDYNDLKHDARDRLGRLYNEADYPSSLKGLFGVEHEFPSVEPPDYLMELNPTLFEQEKTRISARFDEAVRLAQEAFTSELAKLVGHLVERLGEHGPEGQKKVFRDSAVTNLREFFDRFENLNVQSDAQLDDLVATARRAMAGTTAQDLRDSQGLRQKVSGQMTQVLAQLDTLMTDAPRRRILRPVAPAAQVA